MDREHDHVIEDPERLRIGLADHPKDELSELLGPQDFGSVEAPVDPNHRFPFRSERSGLFLVQTVRQSEPSGEVPGIRLRDLLRDGRDGRC